MNDGVDYRVNVMITPSQLIHLCSYRINGHYRRFIYCCKELATQYIFRLCEFHIASHGYVLLIIQHIPNSYRHKLKRCHTCLVVSQRHVRNCWLTNNIPSTKRRYDLSLYQIQTVQLQWFTNYCHPAGNSSTFLQGHLSLFCVLEEYYGNKLHILCQIRGSTPALQAHTSATTPLLTVQNYWVRHNVHIRFREKSVKRFENINVISLALTHMRPAAPSEKPPPFIRRTGSGIRWISRY